MPNFPRTDLAVEAEAIHRSAAAVTELPGVRAEETERRGFAVTEVHVLDVAGETAALGKTAGADAARGKPTYPSVHGLERAAELARERRNAAVAALDCLGARAADLVALADLVVERSH